MNPLARDWHARSRSFEYYHDELAMYRGQTKPEKEATSIAIVRDVMESQTGLYDGKKWLYSNEKPIIISSYNLNMYVFQYP